MGVIHGLAEHGDSGLAGIQSNQRDWSPFVAHFTSYSAMSIVRDAVPAGCSAVDVRELLEEADSRSFEVVKRINASGSLLASGADEGVLPRTCFSECSLPGLVAHCERFGRFGLVFAKHDLFVAGGRPCLYVERDLYGLIASRGRGGDVDDGDARLLGLANVYSPPGAGQVQDFTHEREWRTFSELDLMAVPPRLAIAPSSYAADIASMFPSVECVVPIDTLFRWGL